MRPKRSRDEAEGDKPVSPAPKRRSLRARPPPSPLHLKQPQSQSLAEAELKPYAEDTVSLSSFSFEIESDVSDHAGKDSEAWIEGEADSEADSNGEEGRTGDAMAPLATEELRKTLLHYKVKWNTKKRIPSAVRDHVDFLLAERESCSPNARLVANAAYDARGRSEADARGDLDRLLVL